MAFHVSERGKVVESDASCFSTAILLLCACSLMFIKMSIVDMWWKFCNISPYALLIKIKKNHEAWRQNWFEIRAEETGRLEFYCLLELLIRSMHDYTTDKIYKNKINSNTSDTFRCFFCKSIFSFMWGTCLFNKEWFT